jgi:hypothetical protein
MFFTGKDDGPNIEEFIKILEVIFERGLETLDIMLFKR